MTTIAQWRFDDVDPTLRPTDAIGAVDALDVETGLVMPAVSTAALGYGRTFAPSLTSGLRASDIIPGSTLLQRDMTIQVVMSWDLATQNTYGSPGTIYARGKGSSAPEYMNAGLELRVVNPALSVGEFRWIWHDLAGALKTQVGGHVNLVPGTFTMLTATRRWVSSTSVVLRYYVGDQLIVEIPSADGSIGGGTTGTTSVGTRYVGAGWTNFLAGTLDEMRVVDCELTGEEIAATWRRITETQPKAYRLVREANPRGMPISSDPASRVQRETNLWGQGLGFAAAQAENVRDNLLPDRAYGKILSRWEGIFGAPAKPRDSVDTRRARIVGRARNRAGVAIGGLQAALSELAATDPSNLQFLAFPQELGKGLGQRYDASELWRPEPAAQWTLGATAQVQAASAADFRMTGAVRNWYTLEAGMPAAPLYGDGQGGRILTKLSPTTLPANAEAGVFFANLQTNSWLLFGLRNAAGVFQIVREAIVGGASGGASVLVASTQVDTWLHMWHQGGTAALYSLAFSTTSGTAGFTTFANQAWPAGFQWVGLYGRSFAALGSVMSATFDETRILCPFGDRSFHFYVYRDPALAGTPDRLGGDAVVSAIKHAYTRAHFITSKSLKCDDATCGCDLNPLGGF